MVKKWAREIIIAGIIGILTPISTSIGSKLATDDWLNYVELVPDYIWIIFGIAIVAWIAYVAIKKRKNEISGIHGILINDPSTMWFPWVTTLHKEVNWRVVGSTQNYNPNAIILAQRPPHCPKCDTELEQNRSFWRGYIWTCAKCNWKKRNKDSFHTEAKRVERITKSELEKRHGSSFS